MPDQFHFNKTNINKVHAQKNRIEYQDILIPELRLRVSETGSKSFCIYKRLRGSKPVRVTIGKYPSVTPEQAKIQARKILASLVEGINPNEQRRISTLRKISLQEAYDDYLANRNLKDKTVTGYKTVMRNQLASLASKALDEIDRESIYTIHKTAKAKGQADLAMRLLRAVFNFARNEYLDENKRSLFPDNPVEVLSHRRQWNNSPRKNTHLRKNEIPLFLSALEEVKHDETYTGISICNALLFALLTGLRRSEILSLKWKDINFQAEYFTIQDPKNSLPLELPITPHIADLFKTQEDRAISNFVFGADNEFGEVKEPKKVVTKVKKLCNACCNFHDLRRTFATTAEHLDIGTYKLKRMMNHSSGRDDVTAGYTILTAETLRSAAEKIQHELISRS
jgi:integrase